MPRIRDLRGPRQRQDAFRLPVLFEMAAIGGTVPTNSTNKTPFANTRGLSNAVLSYFEFSTAERNRNYRSGKNELEWDVRYTIKSLQDDGLVVREPRQQYSITNAGFGKLRAFLTEMPGEEANAQTILHATGYAGDELTVAVLKSVDSPKKLSDCVRNSSDQVSLYRAAVMCLSGRLIAKICAHFQDIIRPVLARRNAKIYGFAPRSRHA